ncbi:MAG: RecX family transcriptional regulator [Prevotellaceae bacterium]|jgi:regulatory protein|nr:RecX family transcriptional regulator [Prevotellaceae bacterium]
MTKKNMSFDEVLQRMEAWCAVREVCVSEATTKMKRWDVNESDSGKIITLLQESKFIDEKRYVKAFVNDKLLLEKWGPLKVKSILKQKGIAAALIEQAINDKEPDVDQDNIVSELLNKKHKSLKTGLNSSEIYAKLMRFGLSRGFDYSLVSKHAENLSRKS